MSLTVLIFEKNGTIKEQTIKKFNEQWEKFLTTSGDDSITAYQEAIKKFNQTWQQGKM